MERGMEVWDSLLPSVMVCFSSCWWVTITCYFIILKTVSGIFLSSVFAVWVENHWSCSEQYLNEDFLQGRFSYLFLPFLFSLSPRARLRIGDCLRQTSLFTWVAYWWLMPPKMRIWSVLEMCSWGAFGAGQFAGLKSTVCLPERQSRLKGA